MAEKTRFNVHRPIKAKDDESGQVRCFSISGYKNRGSRTKYNAKGKPYAVKMYDNILDVHEDADQARLLKAGVKPGAAPKKTTGSKETDDLINKTLGTTTEADETTTEADETTTEAPEFPTDDDGKVDYEKMTVAQLKDLAKKRELPFNSGITKANIIALLKIKDDSESA